MTETCACVVESLSVAEALAARHMSLRIVGSSVLLARAAVQQCEALFDEATVTDTEAGWAEWMRTGQKFEALQQALAEEQPELLEYGASKFPEATVLSEAEDFTAAKAESGE